MSFLVSSSTAPPPRFSLLPRLICHSPLPNPPLRTCTHTARWNQRGRGTEQTVLAGNACKLIHHAAPAGARRCPENSLPPAGGLPSRPPASSTALSGKGRRKSTDRQKPSPSATSSQPPPVSTSTPTLLSSAASFPTSLLPGSALWVSLLPRIIHHSLSNERASTAEHHQPYLESPNHQALAASRLHHLKMPFCGARDVDELVEGLPGVH